MRDQKDIDNAAIFVGALFGFCLIVVYYPWIKDWFVR